MCASVYCVCMLILHVCVHMCRVALFLLCVHVRVCVSYYTCICMRCVLYCMSMYVMCCVCLQCVLCVHVVCLHVCVHIADGFLPHPCQDVLPRFPKELHPPGDL